MMKVMKRPGFRRSVLLVLAAVMLLGMTACAVSEKEPMRAPTAETVSIETAYGSLAFPKELQENLRHTETTEGPIAMEVFCMVSEAGEKELYRIFYGDAQMGELIGYLTTEQGEVSVSYTLCEYENSAFATEEERKLYYSMMDAFSTILNSIYADARFSESRHQEPVKSGDVKLRYWNVELPENVQFTESEENGIYRVEFYGEVSGERIDLFMIGLGEMKAETMLGMYTVNGVQKPVMIQTSDLSAYDIWPEEERMMIHQMMAPLNTLIQTIVTDENFSEYASDAGVG